MVQKVTFEDEVRRNKELKMDEFNNLKDWYLKQNHLPKISGKWQVIRDTKEPSYSNLQAQDGLDQDIHTTQPAIQPPLPDHIKLWLSGQDEMLALFFHSCYFHTEPTKVTIDNYFTVRTHLPEFFEDRDPYKTNIKKGKPVLRFFMLNNPTTDGHRVIFVKFNSTDASDFNFATGCKSFIMHADVDAYLHGSAPGFIILFDMEGIGLGHLARLNVLVMKKILYYLQEAMPVRLKGLHFINVVPFMDKILAMMKPFLKKELLDVMVLHMDGIHTLYKSVPQHILPSDYQGGQDEPIHVINEKSVKLLQEHKKWLLEEEVQLRADESKRAGKAKNVGDIFGVEGSFKKLDID